MANTISWGQLSWSAGNWGLQDLQEGWGYNTWGTTAWGNSNISVTALVTGQQTSLDTGVAIVDFADLSFTGVTLTAAGALIYNTSATNKAVCVLDFGGDKTATAGTFTIVFPAFTSANAILRIS